MWDAVLFFASVLTVVAGIAFIALSLAQFVRLAQYPTQNVHSTGYAAIYLLILGAWLISVL